MTSLHTLKSTDRGAVLDPVMARAAGGIATGYTALAVAKVGSQTALFGYDKTTQKTDVYTLLGAAPWVQLASAKPDLSGGVWDSMSTFVLGNEPYLMAYERDHGTFGFFRITPELGVSQPYSFVLPRNTPTKGFTTVAPYTSLGQTTITGYDFDTGTVANFSLNVTATSPAPGVPPLLALNTWYHQWAKGWTRFAFFQLGGANFFFKINTLKLNVNIDHMQDNPAMGSVEVGSYLQAQLPDALQITNTAALPWANGEPYLMTYIAPTGATSVYRIHADCQGWTRTDASTTETNAAIVMPYRINDTTYVLFYHDK